MNRLHHSQLALPEEIDFVNSVIAQSCCKCPGGFDVEQVVIDMMRAARFAITFTHRLNACPTTNHWLSLVVRDFELAACVIRHEDWISGDSAFLMKDAAKLQLSTREFLERLE